MSLERLVNLSHEYGNTPGYVLGGGGNTSYKDSDTLWVKTSGQSLATIQADGFVALDRSKIRAVLAAHYPEDVHEREALVLSNLMDASRVPPARPSVETFLHELLAFPYVVHTHPTVVNALTCAQNGREAALSMFPEALWVEYTDPGYRLAAAVERLVEDRQGKVNILLLENHGLVVAGSTPDAVAEQHRKILGLLPRTTMPDRAVPHRDAASSVENLLNRAFAERRELSFSWSSYEATSQSLGSAFTPDQIVYMGVRPLFPPSPADLGPETERYRAEFGRDPRVAVLPGLGAVAFASSPTAAQLARQLFEDAVRIAQGTQRYGGPKFLSRDAIEFILNWEAERFRSRASGAG